MRDPPQEPESIARALEFAVLVFQAGGTLGEHLEEALRLAAEEGDHRLSHPIKMQHFNAKDAEDPSRCRDITHKISAGTYDLIVLDAPCKSFRRHAFSSRRGEAPCRDLAWTRGFPWLENEKAELVRSENAVIDALVRMAALAADLPPREWRITRIWLGAPEDRGSHRLGSPASIWQWPAVQELQPKLSRCAFHACSFDRERKSLPSAGLSNIPEWLTHDCMRLGWPYFNERECQGRLVPRLYGGPLEMRCEHRHHRPLARNSSRKCSIVELSFARAIWHDFERRRVTATPTGGPSIASTPVHDIRGQPSAHDEEFEELKWSSATKNRAVTHEEATSKQRTAPPDASPQTAPSAEEIGEEVARRSHVTTVEEPDTDVSDTDKDPLHSGWHGIGDKMTVGRLSKQRSFIDGGGLCSPGLWPPGSRNLPKGTICKFRSILLSYLGKREAQHPGFKKGLLADLIKGETKFDPFPEADLLELRTDLKKLLSVDLADAVLEPQRDDRVQIVQIRLLSETLRACQDPDWKGLHHFLPGIRYGVDQKLPRTPAVFPPKKKWRLPEQQARRSPEEMSLDRDLHEGSENLNYRSATKHPLQLQAILDEKAKSGKAWKMSLNEARKRFGTRLTIASLGALVKSTDPGGDPVLRLLFDGTHGVRINTAIRVRDQQQTPMTGDIKTQLRVQSASGRPAYALTFDIEGAHENIPVHPDDWAYQAVRGVDENWVYIMLFGVFGMASISYWWSRLAAALLRMIHYVLGMDMQTWALLFADDYQVAADGPRTTDSLLLSVLVARVFGFPIQWSKCSGGSTYSWIGLELALREARLGISEKRAMWMDQWLTKVLEARSVLTRDLRDALGRMSFVYGALDADRPFLGPLFSYVAVSNPSAFQRLPLFALLILDWLRERLRERRTATCATRKGKKRECFRIDAKAEGDKIVIGGWEPNVYYKEKPDLGTVRWFSVELTRENAPWAFCRGEPYRVVSALELLASTMAILLFGPKIALPSGGTAVAVLTGHTDSMVSTHVVARGMSTSFPLCVVAMEMAAQLEARGTVLHLEWAPRTHNQEADDLTNEAFGAFNPRHRIHVEDWTKLPWLVLPTFLAKGMEFYSSIQEQKLKRKEAGEAGPVKEPKRSRESRLRVKEPW